MVGAYVLFMGIAGSLMAFLDAGVFAFSYPGLINAHQKKQPALFRNNLLQLLVLTCLLTVAFVFMSLLLLSPLLGWLGNPLYVAQQNIYPWLLAVMVVYALGMVPHYALYAQGLDRPIIQSHIASLFLFVIATWLFSQRWPLLAVPLGLCAAVTLILVWKSWAFYRFTPLQYRSRNHIESC